MNDVKISFCAPSIRPHLWKQFCDSLANTKVPWEAVFVGPLPPVESLPSNFRWIKSNVKPSQCTHIAFMEAKGEFLALTADDAQYFSPDKTSSTDNMISFIENFPYIDDYAQDMAFGYRMFEDNYCVETSLTHKLSFVHNVTSPLLFPFFVVHKSTYLKLHGYDTRFVCGQAENDFLLRIATTYGHTVSTLAPKSMVWANHDSGHENKSKFREYHFYETEVLKELWSIDGSYVHKRQRTLNEYTNDDTLYTKTQGKNGRVEVTLGEWE